MARLDTKALEGILDFLVKSRRPKKNEFEEVLDEGVEDEEIDDLEEVEEDMDEVEELEEEVRRVPGKKPKASMISITALGLKSKPKEKKKRK